MKRCGEIDASPRSVIRRVIQDPVFRFFKQKIAAMNIRKMPIRVIGIAVLTAVLSLSAAEPAAKSGPNAPDPSTDPDLIRLNFLGDRLTSDETSIAALNKALVMSGYQAARVGEQADAAQANIKRYDNNGGGPVRWQDFYGKTAKDFVGVHRPNQVFNYVYRAQQGTISQAQQQVAQLGQKTDVLLAERRRRESEQSSLWATIAFTAIENRDISTRALYRYRLADAAMRASDNAPARNPKLDFLRKAVLYVRTLDHTVNALSDRLDNDQGTAYQALRDTLKGIQTDVQTEGNDFADSGGAASDVKSVSDIVTQTKAIKEYCQNMCEAYPEAMARDAAGDEKEKLHLRGLLQQSLLGLSSSGVELDDSLVKLGRKWEIKPDKDVVSPDRVGDVVMPSNDRVSKAASAPDVQARLPGKEPLPAANPSARRLDLLALVKPEMDATSGTWTLQGGALCCKSQSKPIANFELPYVPPSEYDYRITFTGAKGIILRCVANGRSLTVAISRRGCGYGFIDGKSPYENMTTKPGLSVDPDSPHAATVKVRKDNVETFVDDKSIMIWKTDFRDLTPPSDKNNLSRDLSLLGFGFGGSDAKVTAIEVIEITGEGTIRRTADKKPPAVTPPTHGGAAIGAR